MLPEGRVLAELAAVTRFDDVRVLAETASTNTVAAASGREGVVVVADFQTAGRGRLDRSWEARPGDGLLVSVVLQPDLPATRRHLTTAAASLAAREAVREVAGVEAEIKWPNDLMLGGAKLAGILAESLPGRGPHSPGLLRPAGTPAPPAAVIVVGMGLNVHGGPPGAAVLDQAAGRRIHRLDLLERWLRALDRRARDYEGVAEDYRRQCSTVGRAVRVELPGEGMLSGVAESIDGDGRLIVRAGDGTLRALTVGDVTHVR